MALARLPRSMVGAEHKSAYSIRTVGLECAIPGVAEAARLPTPPALRHRSTLEARGCAMRALPAAVALSAPQAHLDPGALGSVALSLTEVAQYLSADQEAPTP